MKKEKEMNRTTAITQELLDRAKAKDREALSELYNSTNQDIYRTVHAMVRDEDLAMDIQQDTYLKAFSRLDQLRDAGSFLPWLRQIAVNEARTQLTKKRPLAFSELSRDDEEESYVPELPDLRPENSPELSLDRKETSRLIREILGGLSDGQRMLLGMFYYEQLPLSKIAEDTGLSIGTIKAQLHRGRKRVETEVRKLEAQGVKLYGLSPLPFLLALMRRQGLPVRESEALLAKTLAETGAVAGMKVAASSGSAIAAETIAMRVSRPFFETLAGKLVLGVLAAGVVAGGVAGYRWYDSHYQQKNEPLLHVDTQSQTEIPNLLVEVNPEETVFVNREATSEDLLYEEETEPAYTEPAYTEPEDFGSGTCGKFLTWNLNSFGTLTIEGSGDMEDYANPQDVPWYPYREEIKIVEFPTMLTSIGDNAFAGCTNLNSVYAAWSADKIPGRCFPEELSRIGDNAFANCAGLYRLNFPQGVREISKTAFQGCDGVRYIIWPEDCATLDADVFSTCTGLQELLILNEGCVITGKLGASSQVTICGLPDSTAERYAEENGCAFNPMVENREEIEAVLKQGEPETYDGETRYGYAGLHYGGFIPVGTRYLTKVSRWEPITATEEELQQARQTGTIVLDGQEYEFTDSKEAAREWFDYEDEWEDTKDYGAKAWIRKQYEYDGKTHSIVYLVVEREDGYRFQYTTQYGDVSDCLDRYIPFGWLWLDADSPVSKNGMIDSMENFGYYSGYSYSAGYAQQLYLNGDGEIVPHWASAGRK